MSRICLETLSYEKDTKRTYVYKATDEINAFVDTLYISKRSMPRGPMKSISILIEDASAAAPLAAPDKEHAQ